ncbi:hypothetical protein DFA_01772 [Cavenderia fasciculata]|uniref:Uncharacterized protein n=1 Tax=Cavenderia fasciculata TaxID=261658 RepID=F4PUM2_CACFS|nr:uncharacterized protein DFA_01772 [Cavenderia fasciculata]EGG21886.1 hypothetical protein DFA_01772 [Cavenderia fasciculata]|eukprot:XP_004359737.1 hypothetical protein DFA_01772 [Cavenderia fasciculata]
MIQKFLNPEIRKNIQKDNNERSRNQPSNNQSGSTVVQTPSKQIGVPKENDDQPQEVSYSQMREMDNDFFKDIIDRTALKFIDVSAVGPDAKDIIFEEKDYSSQIKETNIGKSNILFGLPHLSQATNVSNLHNLLSQPVPFDSDLMNKFNSNIVSSLNNVAIKDCGDLVVTFGASLKN